MCYYVILDLDLLYSLPVNYIKNFEVTFQCFSFEIFVIWESLDQLSNAVNHVTAGINELLYVFIRVSFQYTESSAVTHHSNSYNM